MKTIAKTLLILACTAAVPAFAELPNVTQDAHGITRVLYLQPRSETTSVALFAHGQTLSRHRSEMESRGEVMAATAFSNQHAQPITRFSVE